MNVLAFFLFLPLLIAGFTINTLGLLNGRNKAKILLFEQAEDFNSPLIYTD